jgi:HK97 family phage prohead protease
VGQTQISLPIEYKADKAKRTIEGFASVFGVRDLGDDIMVAGAFKRTLSSGRGSRSPLLWQHDPNIPIGAPILIREEAKGLFFVDRIAKTQQGDEALELASLGAVSGVSIGYEPKIFHIDHKADGGPVRMLQDVELFERSVVTFPMNEAARITAAHKRFWPGWSASKQALGASAEGPLSVGEAIGLLLVESEGNREQLLEAMAEGAGLTMDQLLQITSGAEQCPTQSTVEALADSIGFDPVVLLRAGNRGGCEYAIPEDADTRPQVGDQEQAGADVHVQTKTKLSDALTAALDAKVSDEDSRADLVKEIADGMGVTTGTVNEVLRGGHLVPEKALAVFARVLDVSLDSLVSALEASKHSGLSLEAKAGRVLSRKNRAALEAARDAIDAVLELDASRDTAKRSDDEDDDEDEKKANPGAPAGDSDVVSLAQAASDFSAWLLARANNGER